MDAGYPSVIFNKLCSSLKSAFAETGAEKAVIGVSGGIDSALAAKAAAVALGRENLLLYFLPYKTSSGKSLEDARLLCGSIGGELEVIDISPVADAFFSISGDMDSLRRGNVMARVRMITLFDRAKANNGVVLGTSNKSELLLGYGTWYGDTASSINVLSDLYKKDVRAVAAACGVPEPIISKPPTADLWPGQTDEQELGFTYCEADNFFYAAIELGMNREEIYSLFGADFAVAVASRVLKNSFKRRLPAVCRVFPREIGVCETDGIFKKLV